MRNKKLLAILFAVSFVFFAVTGIFAGSQASSRILSQYGYTGDYGLLGAADYAVILCIAAVFAAILTVVVFALQLRAEKQKKRRIDGLAVYLRQMNEGQYTLRPDIKEDELSPLEDELYKSVILLREGREVAQTEKERLAENLSDIAHQLKTPLASITLMSDLLSAEAVGQQAEYLMRITMQVERLNALVSALLALSRLDAGTLALEQKPVDVRELFESVRDSLLPMLESKGQTLTLPANEAVFLGDFYWSSQAFLNIVKNCCEHTPDGGTITVAWEENPICTVITVEDSGPGIPAEDLPHLFTRFYRGKNAAKDSAGIGLALAKAVIARQNGELTAKNSPEGGAIFTAKFYHGA